MNTGKISVIVPIYNTRDYLCRCVDSIILQTYRDLEIILVDDGSTDGSATLCKQYAEKDGRVVFLQKENGGQGSARNMALDAATGDYIGFVDSDDYIDADMYKSLLSDMLEENADVSCCALSKESDNSGVKRVLTQPDIMVAHLNGEFGLGQSPCIKLYKKELFDGVRFPHMRAYEDCATIFRVLAKAGKTVSREVGSYHYEERENSTMTQSFSRVKYQAVNAYQQMYAFYEKEYPEFAHKVKRMLVGSVQYCVGETLARGMQRELADELKRAISLVSSLPMSDLSLKNKVNIFLMRHALPLYGIMYKILK